MSDLLPISVSDDEVQDITAIVSAVSAISGPNAEACVRLTIDAINRRRELANLRHAAEASAA